ncbi:MAG: hypothetical protein CMC35_03040 [Flavobacteriaceae bacterium]|nr:hypothetical protein [Flavobacteriaceae bacterium]|tara:strand:+ start:560 stop:1273 length:714 start_codon:yes stop_codon:yes gene_type:complete
MAEEANTEQKAAGTGGVIFGITSETKSSNLLPISVPKQIERNAMFPRGWQFPTAKLVNVVFNPAFEKKDGSKVPILQFVFKSGKNSGYTHFEFAPDQTDEKFQSKYDGFNTRIAHIYEQAIGPITPEVKLGAGASNFSEYFELIGKAFNEKVDADGKKLYAKHSYYIKLTYFNANVTFPLGPNFIERKAADNSPCINLDVNTAYDKLEATKAPAPNVPGMSGGVPDGDLPDFNGGFN